MSLSKPQKDMFRKFREIRTIIDRVFPLSHTPWMWISTSRIHNKETLMVKVHIWLPDSKHVGHTSLSVKNDYVSFWPDGSANKKDLKIKRSQPGMLVQSLHEDIRNEGNRRPVTIDLPNLNEDMVLDFLADMQRNTPRYQIARNNCSHIVANALIAGAGNKPSFTPHAGHYSKMGRFLGIGIWTPDQIMRFAKELQSA